MHSEIYLSCCSSKTPASPGLVAHSMMKVAIYTRVSKSDGSQTVNRQSSELGLFCESQGWVVIEEVKEEISGKHTKRDGTQRLINLARSNQIQKVVIHEISRLGRNLADAVNTVEELAKAKVSVYDVQMRQETLDDNYNKTVFALMVLPVLSGIAEQWTQQHSYRIKSGLDEAKRRGKKLGRPEAQKIKKEEEIVRLLQERFSIRKAAAEAGVSAGTVKQVKKKREDSFYDE